MDEPLEFTACPANDIEIDPLESGTQLRPVEVAVVADPASNDRVVNLGQILQGLVAAQMKPPAPDLSADALKPRKSNEIAGKSPRRFASLQ